MKKEPDYYSLYLEKTIKKYTEDIKKIKNKISDDESYLELLKRLRKENEDNLKKYLEEIKK